MKFMQSRDSRMKVKMPMQISIKLNRFEQKKKQKSHKTIKKITKHKTIQWKFKADDRF